MHRGASEDQLKILHFLYPHFPSLTVQAVPLAGTSHYFSSKRSSIYPYGKPNIKPSHLSFAAINYDANTNFLLLIHQENL